MDHFECQGQCQGVQAMKCSRIHNLVANYQYVALVLELLGAKFSSLMKMQQLQQDWINQYKLAEKAPKVNDSILYYQ